MATHYQYIPRSSMNDEPFMQAHPIIVNAQNSETSLIDDVVTIAAIVFLIAILFGGYVIIHTLR